MKNYTFRFREIHYAQIIGTYNLRDAELVKVDLDSVSVEQYVGMEDCDGQRIFENDIVEITKKTSHSNHFGVSQPNLDEVTTSVGIVKYIAPSFVVYYPSKVARINYSEALPSDSNDIRVLADIGTENFDKLLK